MPLAHEFDVAVVGGGYSGSLTTAHLLLHSALAGRRIALLHGPTRPGRGLAYGTWDDNLLLNVPAGNMSAWDGQHLHFVQHLQRIDPSLHEGSFVSRRLYGDYLEAQLQQARTASAAELQALPLSATAVVPLPGGGFRVATHDGPAVHARRVVLALGHLPPRWPAPWDALPPGQAGLLRPDDAAALQALPAQAPVLVLGTGLTAVDLLFQLSSHAPRQVLLLSRRGLLPQAHRNSPQRPTTDATPPWHGADARALLRGLREAARQRVQAGGDWRDAVNALRPHTPALWQALPLRERARFAARLAPYWDVHRHRLAPVAAHRLAALRDSGQVQVLAGRVLEAAPDAGGWRVGWRARADGAVRTLRVAAVVNATGPSTDLAAADDPLLQQLLATGQIAPDPLRLGLALGPDLALLDAQGRAQRDLFYVGPWLRAARWEATAVPELRQHVRQVAQRVAERMGEPVATAGLTPAA